jgi:hypothetical protein
MLNTTQAIIGERECKNSSDNVTCIFTQSQNAVELKSISDPPRGSLSRTLVGVTSVVKAAVRSPVVSATAIVYRDKCQYPRLKTIFCDDNLVQATVVR